MSDFFDNFFNSDFAKGELKKTAATDETNAAHPNGGTDTEGVSSIGANPYDVGTTATPGDAHVETHQEIQNKMLEVAKKPFTGSALSDAGLKSFSRKTDKLRKEVLAEAEAKKLALKKASQKVRTAKVGFLEALTKIASDLDEQGDFEEANEIDGIIMDEINDNSFDLPDIEE